MPRPAPKRNRRTKTTASKVAHATGTAKQNDSTAKSPSVGRESASDPRRALGNQTPLTKNHEEAIASSPGGYRPGVDSQPGTGSRPPTRSRGYSSTLSFAGRKGEMSSRIPGTPGYDSSVLSNFRRRPRQQSILQMMQAEDGSSELENDDFLGGLSPEDESTPLNLTRGKPLVVRSSAQSSSPSMPGSILSEGSRKRKRTKDVQVLQSPSQETQDLVQTSPSKTLHSREGSQQGPEETPRFERHPDVLSQTMAPPASSSPQWSPQSSIAVILQSPRTIQNHVLRSTKSKDLAHLSTAILQDKLLPRRRQRRGRHTSANQIEIHNGENDDGTHDVVSGDDDELSYLPSRRRRRAARPKRSEPLINTREEPRINNTKERKSHTATARKLDVKLSRTRNLDTYSGTDQHGDVDKENEPILSSPSSTSLSSPPDSDDSESDTGTIRGRRYISDELRAAALKFAEIDKWEMEFEDVSASETQGSPGR